jgi:nanoRNase/pAp phosphatase (c-di-AMP/oligoRNAs hydrolase)
MSLDPASQGQKDFSAAKRGYSTVAERNRAIAGVTRAMEERSDFLVLGHESPDDDCVASIVAFSLLLSRLGKRARIYSSACDHEQFKYLIDICRYNAIEPYDPASHEGAAFGERPEAIVILDTPKPSMIEWRSRLEGLFSDPAIPKIELDHHLMADSAYSGDPGYRLVDEASSTCELIGLLALKMNMDSDFLERHGIGDIFTRNLVLAILSGIIGDSRMGLYLKSRREKWFYRRFSAIFEEMLERKTFKGRGNFATKEEVYSALATLSGDEEACLSSIMDSSLSAPRCNYALLGAEESGALIERFGREIVGTCVKAAADALAEGSGGLGFLAYVDEAEGLLQCKLRRSHGFDAIDLRELIQGVGIKDGGGHPGAVAFRFPLGSAPDLSRLLLDILGWIANKIQ